MKFTLTDILFMVFLGPIPPSMLFGDDDLENPPPEPIEVPDQTVGAIVGVLFGTKMIKQIHTAWWGDVKIVMISVGEDAKKG